MHGRVSADLAGDVAKCNANGETEDTVIVNMIIQPPSKLLEVCTEHRAGKTPFDKRVRQQMR